MWEMATCKVPWQHVNALVIPHLVGDLNERPELPQDDGAFSERFAPLVESSWTQRCAQLAVEYICTDGSVLSSVFVTQAG